MSVRNGPMKMLHERMVRSAVFDASRMRRYELVRIWDEAQPPLHVVGLNPSTADENLDDPTIRRCIRFAHDWGYGGLVMTNLFSYRATDPIDMRHAASRGIDVVGPDNDGCLRLNAKQAGMTLAAWGVHGVLFDRAKDVLDQGLLGDVHVLGLTKDGHPRHPLYVKASTVPVRLNHEPGA